jgi:ABC-2 type transport system permease protein
MGTLDFMLASPNRLAVLLFGSSLWSHAFGAVTLAVYLIVGAWLGMDLTSANVPLTLLALVLAVVSFNALGLIAASGVILIKQGDPVTWVISTASLLLAGIFYPTSVLPAWLQAVAQLLPLTHALEVVRRAGLANEGLSTLWPSLAALAALTAALLTLGLVACHFAVRIARTDGSLSYY